MQLPKALSTLTLSPVNFLLKKYPIFFLTKIVLKKTLKISQKKLVLYFGKRNLLELGLKNFKTELSKLEK